MIFMTKLGLISAILLICSAILGAAVAVAADREIPMWEGIEKTTAQKAADRAFVQKIVEAFNGDTEKAARNAVLRGWKAIEKGDPEKALRRFNQAWLVNPKLGDIYWGFAIAIGMRGDDLQLIEKWFKKAEAIVGPDWRLHSDWGRLLEQRNQLQAAISHFLISIQANPNNPEPHVGMIYASRKLGDLETAEKHLNIYRQLTE